MKRLLIPFLLITFAGLVYLSGNIEEFQLKPESIDSDIYSDGVLNSEINNIENIADYDIDVSFDFENKKINATQTITWINKSKNSTNELHFHLYPNAYKSERTLFAKGYDISADDAKTEMLINYCKINGEISELIYFQPETPNRFDSTVAKINLDKSVEPGDTIKITFEYSLRIPRSVKRFGYAEGRNFYFISQWFPKIGVLEDHGWVCSQYHPYLNFYSNFGRYSVQIKVPENFIVGATGVEKEKYVTEKYSIYKFVQNGVHDFVWFVADKILTRNDVYTRNDGTQILIQTYVQPERRKYINRYIETVKNCLSFFEKNIGIYPYQNITLVDVPRTSGSGGMEYPTLFTVSAELFSPQKTGMPEYLVAHEFSYQYFYGIIANNEVYEAWLDEGFASYTATKIMYEYYPEILEHFKFITYLPIYGLNFLSYNEIPIIYSMVDIHIDEGLKSAVTYYKSPTIGTLRDTSYKLPNRMSYVINSYAKPELVLLTLERYLGFEKMMGILKNYYDTYKYRHPKSEDFLNIVQNNTEEDIQWFIDEFINSSRIFDYKISYIKKITEDKYEVMAERLCDGIFKYEIVLYTDKDTLMQKWEDRERWKIFTFETRNRVIAAEIDPGRKNLLDINFANNSYTIEPRIWGSLSISIRWFFWIQNALMVLGSIG